MNKGRFIAGWVLLIASAVLMLAARPSHSPSPYIGLMVVGIVLIATAKRKAKKPPSQD